MHGAQLPSLPFFGRGVPSSIFDCYWLLLVASKTGEIRLEWKPLVSSHSISTESGFFFTKNPRKA